MKTFFFFQLCFVLFSLALTPLAHAQAPRAAPIAAGYWNVETNLTMRDYTIVRFYNGQDQLVYEERLANICLDLSKGSARRRRRTARQLTTALQQVLRDPASASQSGWLAQQFGLHHVPRVYAVR